MTNTAAAEPTPLLPWPDHLLTLDEWDALDEELLKRAEVGIAHYGILDLDGPTLTEFTPVDGAYRLVAEHRGTAALALGATLDLDALGALPPA